MLALFFALGRFLSTLGPLLRVSGLLVGVLGWFCYLRECSGVDFGWFGSLPGMFLEPPTRFFFSVLSASVPAFRTNAGYAKT